MNRFTAVVWLAPLLLAACQTAPRVQTGEDFDAIEGNLVRVDGSFANFAYVDPNADFSKWNRPEDIAFRMEEVLSGKDKSQIIEF